MKREEEARYTVRRQRKLGDRQSNREYGPLGPNRLEVVDHKWLTAAKDHSRWLKDEVMKDALWCNIFPGDSAWLDAKEWNVGICLQTRQNKRPQESCKARSSHKGTSCEINGEEMNDRLDDLTLQQISLQDYGAPASAIAPLWSRSDPNMVKAVWEANNWRLAPWEIFQAS